MIRISNLENITSGDIRQTIPKLLQKVNPVLEKRKELHEIYSKGANDSTTMFSEDNTKTIVSYEKFLTDISAGYLSGNPSYSTDRNQSEEESKLIEEVLEIEQPDETTSEEMQILIDYITKYNDDLTEHHNLVHDILELTSCYEIIYENQDNEIVYSRFDPLTTVAIWDYNIPANLIGLVRTWDEKDINDNVITKCELTDKTGIHIYSITNNYSEVKLDDMQESTWDDVPAIAVETDYAIFEPCEDIIKAYTQLIQNIRNTYQYNDSDCKLMFSGYMSENPIMIPNPETGILEENQARKDEDNYLLKSRTLYVQEGGKVEWLQKPIETSGAVEILKTYTNLMFQLAGIPNTSDLAFNSADLNASAIDRKFYIMNMMTANIISELKKAYLRRWELIFGRINLKKNKNYDFRNISIELPKNLPANNDELIDSTLKLKDILSEQTIIEKLGYNYLDEKSKKDDEATENLMQNIDKMKQLSANGITSEEESQEKNEEIEKEN